MILFARGLVYFCCAWLMLSLVSCASKPKSTVTGTKPYTVRGQKYYPLQSAHGFVEEGVASWYGPGFHGKTTANGETYNQNAMTAAHKLLPLGTTVRVTNLENNKSLVLRINDRGPFVHDRVIDVSKRAAERLDMHEQGTANVRIEAINTKPASKTSSSATKAVVTAGAVTASSSSASSASAIEEARKSRVLNEDGEIPDELKYLFEEEGSSSAKSEHAPEPQNYAQSESYVESESYAIEQGQVDSKGYAKTQTYNEVAPIQSSAMPTSVDTTVDGDVVFYIQVGAFEVKKFASFLAETFKDRGFPARSYKEPNQKLWRVRIGPWSNQAKAAEFLPRFTTEYPEASIVTGKPKQY